MQQASVFILYTGGTIGMAAEDSTNAASPLVPKPLNGLIEWIPSWSKGGEIHLERGITLANGIRLGFDSFDEPLDSSNVTPDDWIKIAQRIEKVYDEYDGFVILHGTDTMAYTASGLAFIFEHLAKPVVVTGSQLPISDERTDAVMNLVNSVHIAGCKATGLPCIPEVVICFANTLIRGCRATKVSSSAWAAFDSPNFPHLGEIGEHILINEDILRPMPAAGQSLQINTDLNTNVLDCGLNPGMTASQLAQLMGIRDIDAVLLRTYGTGNAPNKESYLNAIEHFTQQKKIIVNVTQCAQGMVEMGRYSASAGLLARGVISGFDMTPEAALTKLYWTLGTKTGDAVVTQMQINQRGEQSQNLFDLRYGTFANSDAAGTKFDHCVTPDNHFDVKRLSRSVVRFKGLGVKGVDVGESVTIRVFMKALGAKSETSKRDPDCVAQLVLTWHGNILNETRVVDASIVRGMMGHGDLALSVRADAGVSFWFDGLNLALFTQA